MKNTECFLTDKKECTTIEVIVDGVTYYVDEEVADEYSYKKLKEKVTEKSKELLEKQEKDKNQAIEMLTQACQVLGYDKSYLAKFLLGGDKKDDNTNNEENEENEDDKDKNDNIETPTRNKKKNQIIKDDGFQEVDGELKSNINASINTDEGVGPSMPAYSNIKDKEGKRIVEQGKRVKRLDDAIVEKSSMGTTVIRMDHRKGSELNPLLTQTNENYELVRAAAAGRGFLSGQRTIECPLCNGSGISKVNYGKCPKCGGTGIITA